MKTKMTNVTHSLTSNTVWDDERKNITADEREYLIGLIDMTIEMLDDEINHKSEFNADDYDGYVEEREFVGKLKDKLNKK